MTRYSALTFACVTQDQIADVVVRGRDADVGFVEAMLLLSENLPRQSKPHASISSQSVEDSMQSWFLVGHAVRTGYLLGLDQVRSRTSAVTGRGSK